MEVSESPTLRICNLDFTSLLALLSSADPGLSTLSISKIIFSHRMHLYFRDVTVPSEFWSHILTASRLVFCSPSSTSSEKLPMLNLPALPSSSFSLSSYKKDRAYTGSKGLTAFHTTRSPRYTLTFQINRLTGVMK